MARKYQIAIQIGVIALISCAVYFPSLKNGFTNWDDKILVLENSNIRSLSVDNVAKIFSASYGGFGGYTPLVFMSYALEYRFFKLDPRAYHATNLLIHILNSLLIYWLIYLVSRKIRLSFIVAAFFGIHPLHVEAVAWIPGRKDVLFSLFYLLALITYLLFLQKRRKRSYYLLALLMFTLSVFSKVTAVSFPLVILLIEFHLAKKLDKSSLARVVPFMILSIGFLFLAVITSRSGLPQAPTEQVRYLQNLGLFFYSFVFYIGKLFLPVGLIARYSVEIGRYPWQILLNSVVFAAVCGFLYFVYRRKSEIVTFGIAFFILTLLPTLPFHFFGQPYADRYMYLPMTGLLFVIAAVLEPMPLKKAGPYFKRSFVVSSLVIAAVVLLGAQTWRLSQVWRDGLSLWTYVLEKDPTNATAYLNRGDVLVGSNQLDQAFSDYEQAARFNPKDPHVYTNKGFIYFKRGQYEKALEEYNRALSLNPLYLVGYLNRGILWGRLGEFEKAVQDFSTALKLDKNSSEAHYYRGLAFKELKMIGPALEDFQAAHRLNPTDRTRSQIELLKREEVK